MNLPKPRQQHRAQTQGAETAWMIPVRGHIVADLQAVNGRATGFQNGHDIRLRVKDIRAAAGFHPMTRDLFARPDARRHHILIFRATPPEDRADFKQGQVGIAAPGIALCRGQQIGQDRRAHRVQIGADRIGQGQDLRIATKGHGISLRQEGPGHGLKHATLGQLLFGKGDTALTQGQDRLRQGGFPVQRDRRDGIKAPHPQHFFDKALFVFDIIAPGWRYRRNDIAIARCLKAQTIQDRLTLFRRNRQTAKAFQAIGAQGQGLAIIRNVARRGQARNLPTAQFLYQACGHFRTPDKALRIQAPLKPIAGIGIDVQAPPGFCHPDRVEQGNLQKNLGRVIGTAGQFTPHDAANPLRACRIANHRHAVFQGIGLLIQRQNGFPRLGPAHGQGIALNFSRIKDMQGPPQIEADIIGDIDQRGNRAQADGNQPPLHPGRRGAILDAPEMPPGDIGNITTDIRRPCPLDGGVIGAFDRGQIQRLQCPQTLCRQIARNTAHAQTITTIRRDRNINHRIIQTAIFRKGHADWRVFGQVDNAIMVITQAHFPLGTQHAIGFFAPDHARLQIHTGARNMAARGRKNALHPGSRIGRATDNLNHVASARFHHADAQSIRIGMLFRFTHIGNGKRPQLRSRIINPFKLQTQRGQRIGDLRQRRIGFKMIFQPG